MAIPHQRRHWLVWAIVGSFGDQPPRVGVGQRFRISTGLPHVNKVQTPPRPVPAELGLTPRLGNTDDRNPGKDSAAESAGADLLGLCTDSKGCAGWVVGDLDLGWREVDGVVDR
jgi:hypothetical protein